MYSRVMCGVGGVFATAEVDSYGDASHTWLGDILADDWESGGGRLTLTYARSFGILWDNTRRIIP